MARLAHIYRHPIKAIGLEEVAQITLRTGETLPGDRVWAVEHEASKFDPAEGWGRCMNFVRGASSAQLMAVRIESQDGSFRLAHPARPELVVDPETAPEALVDWVRPLCNPDRAQPVRVVRATRQGMTDNRNPYLSVLSLASLDAFSQAAGTALARERFRGNLWLEDLSPWEEFDWIGRRLRIGDAVLEVEERIERCVATGVNPDTGVVDTDTLGVLHGGWGHQDFGVFARVIEGGEIRPGDDAVLR